MLVYKHTCQTINQTDWTDHRCFLCLGLSSPVYALYKQTISTLANTRYGQVYVHVFTLN